MSLYEQYLKARGWFHNLLGLAFVYAMMYHGASAYAKAHKHDSILTAACEELMHAFVSGKLWPVIGAVVVYNFLPFFKGCAIELLQCLGFKAEWQWSDVKWTWLGGPEAMVLYVITGQSKLVFILSLAILTAGIVYTLMLVGNRLIGMKVRWLLPKFWKKEFWQGKKK